MNKSKKLIFKPYAMRISEANAWNQYYKQLDQAQQDFLEQPYKWLKDRSVNSVYYLELIDLNIDDKRFIFQANEIETERSLYYLDLWDAPELVVNHTLSSIYLERQKAIISKIYDTTNKVNIQPIETSYDFKFKLNYKILALSYEYEYRNITKVEWFNSKYLQLLILDCNDNFTRSFFLDLTSTALDFFELHLGPVLDLITNWSVLDFKAYIREYLVNDYKNEYTLKSQSRNFINEALNKIDILALRIAFKRLNDIIEVVYEEDLREDDKEHTRGILAAWRLGLYVMD